MDGSFETVAYPSQGALMGLDYGTRRIGIAVSTPDQTIASPLNVYTLRVPHLDAAVLRAVAEDYRVVGLVVGLPVHMSGDEGGKAAEARAFGEWVARELSLPVRFWDERYSTAAADVLLFQSDLSEKQRKARRDKLAAQVVLQSYLDADDRERPPGPLRA